MAAVFGSQKGDPRLHARITPASSDEGGWKGPMLTSGFTSPNKMFQHAFGCQDFQSAKPDNCWHAACLSTRRPRIRRKRPLAGGEKI